MYILCSWWICSFFVSMRVHDFRCARTGANITQKLLFLKSHSMREASRIKLQFLQYHLYI